MLLKLAGKMFGTIFMFHGLWLCLRVPRLLKSIFTCLSNGRLLVFSIKAFKTFIRTQINGGVFVIIRFRIAWGESELVVRFVTPIWPVLPTG